MKYPAEIASKPRNSWVYERDSVMYSASFCCASCFGIEAFRASLEKLSVVPAPTPIVPDPTERDLPMEARAATLRAVGGGEYRRNQAQSQQPTVVDPQPETERFFERSYDAELARMVASIVESEGPILDEVLTRRIARMHGWQRTGTRITERVTRIASRAFKKTNEDVGAFFWPRNLETGQPVPFRSGLDRSVDEICLSELVSLALDVLAIGKTGDDAVNAMAKRLRATSRPRLAAALARAKRRVQS